MALASLFFGGSTMLILAVTQTMIECNSCRIPLQRKGGGHMHLIDDILLIVGDLVAVWLAWWLDQR